MPARAAMSDKANAQRHFFKTLRFISIPRFHRNFLHLRHKHCRSPIKLTVSKEVYFIARVRRDGKTFGNTEREEGDKDEKEVCKRVYLFAHL
jgi:hypothetical protein